MNSFAPIALRASEVLVQASSDGRRLYLQPRNVSGTSRDGHAGGLQ